jgi:hypothetical protein
MLARWLNAGRFLISSRNLFPAKSAPLQGFPVIGNESAFTQHAAGA